MRISVNSSDVSALGFEHDSQVPELGELEVTFRNGSVYTYSAVPRIVYDELLAAPSVGSALHRLIKRGGYSYNRLS